MSDMDTAKAMQILGLDGNPSPTDIKKAYREQVKIWHPDRYSEGSALQRLAEKNIQDANLAYAHIKRHMPAEPQKKRRAASETEYPSSSFPSSPSSSAAQPLMSHRLLSFFLSMMPARIISRLLLWLQNSPRHRFRPWYRYPISPDTTADRRHTVDFDQFLQNAMQDRNALKRIHRTRRRSLDQTGEDKVRPVTAATSPRKVERNPSSGEK
jgi:hypothetical protein